MLQGAVGVDFFWKLEARGWMLEKRPDTQEAGLNRSPGQSEMQAIHSAAVKDHSILAAGREEQKRGREGARIGTFPAGSV